MPAALVGVGRAKAGLHLLQKLVGRTDPQDMTSNDEPIYEALKRECNWDPERCEQLSFTTSVGRHVG